MQRPAWSDARRGMTDPDEAIDVLLIEDDERLAQLTARYFEQHGHRVTIRHDGAAGYEEAMTHP